MVRLDDADRLICNMIFSGQVMTLAVVEIFQMTFQCQITVHSIPIDERHEHNVGKINVVTVMNQKTSYHFLIKRHKTEFYPLEVKSLTLGQS